MNKTKIYIIREYGTPYIVKITKGFYYNSEPTHWECLIYEACECIDGSIEPVNSEVSWESVGSLEDATVIGVLDIRARGCWDERFYFKDEEYWADTAIEMMLIIKDIINNKEKYGIKNSGCE